VLAIEPNDWNASGTTATDESGNVSVLAIEPNDWNLKYSRVSTEYTPWVGLAVSWGADVTYYAPDELAAVADGVRAELAALQQRAAAHGWTIEAERKATYSDIQLIGPHGGRDHAYYWSTLIEKVEAIEAGKLVDRPTTEERPGGVVTAQPSRQPSYAPKCAECKQESNSLQWIDGRTLCETCRAPIVAAQKAAQAAVRATVEAALGAWLRAAPAGAIPLLVASLGDGDRPFDSFGVDWMLSQITEVVQELDEDDYDDAPSVARLLGMGQATDQLPGSSSPAEVAEPSATHANVGLDQVAAALAVVEAWATRYPDADAEEIRVNLNELHEAERLLQDLADADIDTEAWERLSHTRGELEVLLRERLEHQKVVGV